MSVRVSRFFTEQALDSESSVVVKGDQAHYIRNVLRLNVGDPLVVFNGTGGEYPGTIAAIDKKSVTITLGAFNPINRTQQGAVALGLCTLKREAMDLTLQKAAELGVSTIQPLISERITVSHKQIQSRQSHWQGVVTSACEQCGLNLVPEVLSPKSLQSWCASTTGVKLIADPDARSGEIPESIDQSYSLLVGPEGGFSAEEITQSIAADFKGIYLGPRILRAETAAISLLALVNQRPERNSR